MHRFLQWSLGDEEYNIWQLGMEWEMSSEMAAVAT